MGYTKTKPKGKRGRKSKAFVVRNTPTNYDKPSITTHIERGLNAMSKKITWNGVAYDTEKELADALGLTPQGITYRKQRGYASDLDLDTTKQAHPCMWEGKRYPSVYALWQEQLSDFTYVTVWKWVHKGYKSKADVFNGDKRRKP